MNTNNMNLASKIALINFLCGCKTNAQKVAELGHIFDRNSAKIGDTVAFSAGVGQVFIIPSTNGTADPILNNEKRCYVIATDPNYCHVLVAGQEQLTTYRAFSFDELFRKNAYFIADGGGFKAVMTQWMGDNAPSQMEDYYTTPLGSMWAAALDCANRFFYNDVDDEIERIAAEAEVRMLAGV